MSFLHDWNVEKNTKIWGSILFPNYVHRHLNRFKYKKLGFLNFFLAP